MPFDVPVVAEDVYGPPKPPSASATTDSIGTDHTLKYVTMGAGVIALIGVFALAFSRRRG